MSGECESAERLESELGNLGKRTGSDVKTLESIWRNRSCNGLNRGSQILNYNI